MEDIAHEGSTEADGWVAEIQVVPCEKSHLPLVAVRSSCTLKIFALQIIVFGML